MPRPTIESSRPLTLAEALTRFAPAQGGIEYQTDQPHKVHAWHSHSVSETLIVLEGNMRLEWAEATPDNVVGQHDVGPGVVIFLPAHTIHQSTNRDAVCRYLIAPEGGKAAETRVYAS